MLIALTVRSIAAAARGSRSVPDSTAKTTFAVSPDAAGKRSSSRSIARWDSVPGVLKSSTNEPPPTLAARPERDEHHRHDREGALPVFRRPGGEVPEEMGHASQLSTSLRICNRCRFATYVFVARRACSLRLAHARRGCGNARSSARASRSSRRPCGLFAERGYQATTIADIATAADVAPRTFFSYFPSKEAVVFHDVDRDLDGLASALRDRLPGETAFDALRRWIDGMFDNWTAEEDEAVLRKRLCREDEGLTNFQGGDDGSHPRAAARGDRTRSRRAAGLATPAPRGRRGDGGAALARTTPSTRSPTQHVRETKTEALAVLDDAMLFLRGGIDALQDK